MKLLLLTLGLLALGVAGIAIKIWATPSANKPKVNSNNFIINKI